MNLHDKSKEGERNMAILINEVTKMSEINSLANKIQSIKLSIVEEIGKIRMSQIKSNTDPNLIMESLMIEYYTSNGDRHIEMAEESIFLADEAENILRKHID